MNDTSLDDRRYTRTLGLILAAAAVFRMAYVAFQPGSDPNWNLPILDGQIYRDWARRLAAGEGTGAGAFYHAPLYPYAMAAVFKLFGERFLLLFALQQGLVVAAGGLLALVTRRMAGSAAALAAATLFLLYAPTTYFASRPLGEALGLFLLLAAFALVTATGNGSAFGAGVVLGLAVLTRANLILLPPLWIALEWRAGRRQRAAVLLLGVVIVVGPVTVRNRVASGHWVPVSANSGLTAFHGNGPGAMGIFTQPAGFSGDPSRQGEEARILAARVTGREMDVVEADRWWGRQALRTRLADPADTVRLAVRRLLLTLDSYEHGLDYPPTLDRNPLRLTFRFPSHGEVPLVPLGLLLGLAAAGILIRGVRGTGGGLLWATFLACLATPLLFYVSSRYRLPAAAILAIPAGIGWHALVEARRAGARQTWWVAMALTITLCAFSLMVPSGELQRIEQAAAWSNRASSWLRADRLDRARLAADRALALDPDRASAHYNLGLVCEAEGNAAQAMASFRDALQRDPGLVRAARHLAGLLMDGGRPAEALGVLRGVMLRQPDCRPCWSDLVLARLTMGDATGARRTAREAARRGVPLDPAVAELLASRTQEGETP